MGLTECNPCETCDCELDERAIAEHKEKRVFNMEIMPYDFPIYRIFHKQYLYDIISKKRNILPHISKWDDPFEGFIFKQVAWDYNYERLVGFDILKDYYGQCWSLDGEETDAKWRIYSPDKHGILVQSTFRKLWDSFYNMKCMHSITSNAIGKVEYLGDEEIKNEFERISIEERFNIGIAGDGREGIKTLLIKRIKFNHEKEIRIIYDGTGRKYLRKKGLMSYPIDNPYKLFCKKLIADPRMPSSCFELLKWRLKAKGFELKKSDLYDVPILNLDFNTPT